METENKTGSNTEAEEEVKDAVMKKSSSKNSESSNYSHMDSPHSPLRFHSPLQSDAGDPSETPPYASPENSLEKPPDNSKAIVLADKCTQFTPVPSPFPHRQKSSENNNVNATPAKSPSSVFVFNRAMREEIPPSVTKIGPAGAVGGDGGVGGGRSRGVPPPNTRRSNKEETVKKAALGFRISEVILCLISFSVMAADKTQGWSGDSYDRYKEYRYCLSVNIIGFVYSGFQAYDLAYNLITGKHVIGHCFRRYFDFFMDQVLAYLLISASSSAATRVDDWQSNWGKDDFTRMASASVSMAFLAFAAFAISSLISGYNLCSHDPA